MDWLIVDWLILVLATPVVIGVVVFLYGFVGCGRFGASPAPPAPPAPPEFPKPTGLAATAIGTERIDLIWVSSAPADTKEFQLERRKTSQPAWEPPKPIPVNPGVVPAFSDPVGEGAAFSYHVQAVHNNGSKSAFSDEASAKTSLKAPSNFAATLFGANEIRLTWTNNSTIAKNLRLDRGLTPGGEVPYKSLLATDTHFEDQGLAAGTKYYYRLTAFGNDNTESAPVEANATTAGTSSGWKTSFEATLNQDAGATYAGACVVQIIPARVAGNPATLQESGNTVRITLFSDGPQETKLTAVSISRVGAPQAYDSASDIKPILFGGAAGVNLSKALGPRVSDPIPYTLDRDQPLIIAFDVTLDSQNTYFSTATGPQVYYHPPRIPGVAFQEAAKTVRTPTGYLGPQANRVVCVRKIEVT